MILTYEQ